MMRQAWEITDLPLHRLLAAGRQVLREECPGSVRLAVAGDAATQHYCAALGAALKLRGWWPEIYEAEFDTIQQELLDPHSRLFVHESQFVVLFPVVQALAVRFSAAANKAAFADSIVGETVDRWERISRRAASTIVQHNFVLPVERPYGNQTLTREETLAGAVASINARLLELASRHGVRLIDTEFQASYFGKRQWFDERLWCQARQALSPTYLPALAKTVTDTVLADLGVGVKCVVVDLDNTLWGGILGEEGLDGIELGPAELGLAFARIQHALVELRDRGILLAICSKNDQALVEQVLDTHPDMVLRSDSFAAIVANYGDKVANLIAIRDRLNIGLDSLLFLDDSPFERDRVRRALPQVQVPELPVDPAAILDSLARWGLFEGRAVTPEDRARRAYYQTDRQRETLQAQCADLEGYLADLQMVAELRGFDAYTMPRIAQLVLRSNQFNLTTIRYSDAELTALGADPDVTAFCVRLSDRVGDNGIVTVVILRKRHRTLVVDTWIMSCRVLGRHMEELTLRLVVDQARLLACDVVVGRFTPTAKNAIVADLYTRIGFTAAGSDGDTQLFELHPERYTPPPVPIECRAFERERG